MTIVICEDEDRLRQFLSDSLIRQGHKVLTSKNFSDFWNTLEVEPHIDVVILDRLVGNKDLGHEIPTILKRNPDTKILILSAIDRPEEKAKLLDLGAHEYLSKPFSFVELEARLRKLQRQNGLFALTVLTKNNVTIDLVRQRVLINREPLSLSAKEFQMLSLFMRHPGRIYNKYQLLDLIWGNNLEVESNVVEATLKNLRKKLSEAQAQLQISTKRGVGYWLED